ncbi:E1 ubiquitin-activating protein aos1 [Coemansia sp. RSA 720]|nr:E1 ubiquitin-activating protein aos1 [Coemansia sp. RSA 720]
MGAISKDEVALYDRQIRLWGMEAQTRLRSSSVCIMGITALSLETAKNLVLSGIGTLTLIDPHEITNDDLQVQYYFDESHIGRPRDHELAEQLRVLNPLVTIRVGERGQEISGFDVVIHVDAYMEAQHVASACRSAGVKFVAAGALGLFGFVFVDCGDRHEYAESTSGAEPSTTTCIAEYTSLSDSLTARVEESSVVRLRRKYPPLVFVFQGKCFHSLMAGVVDTEDELVRLVRSSLQSRSIPSNVVDHDIISRVAQSLGTEFVPCAAVVGGTLAQEVLKIITRKDMPINNWYTYDALKGDAITCTLKP